MGVSTAYENWFEDLHMRGFEITIERNFDDYSSTIVVSKGRTRVKGHCSGFHPSPDTVYKNVQRLVKQIEEKENKGMPNYTLKTDRDAYCDMFNSIYRAHKSNLPAIKNVIFNDPATIVFWADKIKTVVKCGENDIYDPEKGLTMAIAKKALGNQGNYYNTIKKWLPEEKPTDPESMTMTVKDVLLKIEDLKKKWLE